MLARAARAAAARAAAAAAAARRGRAPALTGAGAAEGGGRGGEGREGEAHAGATRAKEDAWNGVHPGRVEQAHVAGAPPLASCGDEGGDERAYRGDGAGPATQAATATGEQPHVSSRRYALSDELRVPTKGLPTLIGVKRRNLNRVERRHGVAVTVAPPPPRPRKNRGRRARPTTRAVRVQGATHGALAAATVHIRRLTARYEGHSRTVYVPEKHVRQLQHHGALREVCQGVGVASHLGARDDVVWEECVPEAASAQSWPRKRRGKRPLTIYGQPKSVDLALKFVRLRLGLWPDVWDWQPPERARPQAHEEGAEPETRTSGSPQEEGGSKVHTRPAGEHDNR